MALEVAGSSPVGHPHYSEDALTPDILRTQGIWRFERNVISPYDFSLLPDLSDAVAFFGNRAAHKKRMVSSSARDC